MTFLLAALSTIEKAFTKACRASSDLVALSTFFTQVLSVLLTARLRRLRCTLFRKDFRADFFLPLFLGKFPPLVLLTLYTKNP